MLRANGTPAPADTLTTTANDLTTKLEDQVQSYETWVGQMEKILVYDYGKLSEVGPAILGNPAWAWGTDARSKAVTALRGNTRASAYSALVPTVWPGYNIKPDPTSYHDQSYTNQAQNVACDSPATNHSDHQYPFANATKANQFWWVGATVRGQPPPTDPRQAITTQQPDGGLVDQAWVFAQLNWAGSGTKGATLPTTDLTHYIYGADSTNGDNGAYQFAPVWWRDTYNPPSYALCYRHPTNQSTNYNSTAHPPPNIPPPPP